MLGEIRDAECPGAPREQVQVARNREEEGDHDSYLTSYDSLAPRTYHKRYRARYTRPIAYTPVNTTLSGMRKLSLLAHVGRLLPWL